MQGKARKGTGARTSKTPAGGGELTSDLAHHMRIYAFEFLVGVSAHPIARASVLSAPVLSHGMPPWGPRTAAGVTPGTSALLADPGSPQM